MISVIVSSYQKHYFENFSKNVETSIGVPYEIIKVDNPGLMGISEAYNKGAKKAQYPYLVFCHEDILFHTQNWGTQLIKQLKDETVGAIGVAGSTYVPKSPSGWYLHNSDHNIINILQHHPDKTVKRTDNLSKSLQDAISLDGVFLAITRKHYDKIKFNEKIKGFHAYDLDFSLRTAQQFQNKVTKEIVIEHFSFGNPDKLWFENTCQIRRSIQYKYNTTINHKIETEVFNRYLHLLFKYHSINFSTVISALKTLPRLSFNNIKGVVHFIKHKKYYNKKNGHE